MRIMICRKEAKESLYWLELIEVANYELEHDRIRLIGEAVELRKIFGAILEESQ